MEKLFFRGQLPYKYCFLNTDKRNVIIPVIATSPPPHYNIDEVLGLLPDLLHDGVDGVSVDDGEGGED